MISLLQLDPSLPWNEVNSALVVRFLINFVAVFILVRGIYFNYQKKSELFLTFFIFNLIIFFVAYLLNKVEMTTGAAFGLFAVFSILRYRTEGIAAIDMTYLFLSIALGLIAAISNGNWVEISLICSTILAVTFALESSFFHKKECSLKIHYDNASLIHFQEKETLLQDLRTRTGLPIHRFVIHEIDFLKDTCFINIYYYA